MLLNFPLGNLKTTIICLQLTTYCFLYIFEKTLIIYTYFSITFIQNTLLIVENVLVLNCQCIGHSEVTKKSASADIFNTV